LGHVLFVDFSNVNDCRHNWVVFGIASMYESLIEDTLIEARALARMISTYLPTTT